MQLRLPLLSDPLTEVTVLLNRGVLSLFMIEEKSIEHKQHKWQPQLFFLSKQVKGSLYSSCKSLLEDYYQLPQCCWKGSGLKVCPGRHLEVAAKTHGC